MEARPEVALGAPGRRLLTAGLILTITLVASEALAVATVMPLVEADLGGLHLYGWVFSAFFLGNLFGIVVAGRAADRVHPAGPFGVGLVLFSAGLLLAALAPSMLALVAARLAQGIGAGALPATAYVCIGRGYPPELRPRMFALLSTAWVVPGLVGPGLAALVGETAGWRWVFGGLIPLVALGGAAATRAIASSIPPSEPKGEVGWSAVRDAALIALAAGVMLGGLGLDSYLAALAVAAAALAGGTIVYRRLVPAGTLRVRPGLPAAVALRGLLTCAFFAADAFMPLALTEVRGNSTALVGVAFTLATLAWTTGAWIQARVVYKVGPRRLVAAGFAGLVLSSLGLLVALGEAFPVALIPAAFTVAGLSMGPAYASISVTVLAEADPGAEGAATSALQLTDVLGVALGTGVAGAIVGAGDDLGRTTEAIGAVFAFAAVVALAGTLLSHRLPQIRSGL